VRIGILGGTFNPPHVGHLVCGQEAYVQLSLSRVILMPAYIPPHKEVEEEPGPEHRLELCRVAIEGDRASRSPRSNPIVSFCCTEQFLLSIVAAVLTFFIAGLLFICALSTSITWERTASRSETGLLIPSVYHQFPPIFSHNGDLFRHVPEFETGS
jgi:hypothetical protein